MRKIIKFAIICYILVLFGFIFILKFFGYPDRYDLVTSDPLSWNEIIISFSAIYKIVLIITIFLTILYILGIQAKAKQEEEYRKKREENGEKDNI